MKKLRLKSKDLAARWGVKESTLSQWRWFGKGPSYFNAGTLVLYRNEDIEQFEDLAIQHQEKGATDEVFSQIRIQKEEEGARKNEAVETKK
ncbi:MAG: hypothetical protein K2X02_02500 [Alphaproteobacteria bacterium]|nr:hypothetical protein [Alphaproteobacteria bacterium]